MAASIEAYDEGSKCVQVMTKTCKRLALHLVTENMEGHNNVTCFPMRVGYVCTVPKIQEQTLEHLTIFLDAAGCRAAAYFAMSRVRYDSAYVIAGKVSPAHFVAAK